MPQPTTPQSHINQPLTNISVMFTQDPEAFIADQIFPTIPVQKQSDTYYVYNRGDFMRDEAQERAPGTVAAETGFSLSNDTYLCKRFSLRSCITEEDRANQDSPLNLDQDHAIALTQKGMIKREVTFATKFMTTGVWALDRAGVTGSPGAGQFKRWDDAAATPQKDVETWKAEIKEDNGTGLEPNGLLIGERVWRALKTCPAIVDLIKYGGQASSGSGNPAIVTKQAVAQVLGIRYLLVGSAVKTTSNEGAATTTTAPIIGKKGLLFYRPETAGLRRASCGYTYAWRGLNGMSRMGHRIVTYTIVERSNTDWVEMDMAYDQKQTSNLLATYLADMVS